MENPSPQPQFFAVNDPSAERERRWFQRPEMVKRIAAIAVGILILGGVGIFVNNLIKSMNKGPKNAFEAAQNEVAQRQADCDPGDEACKNKARSDVARSVGLKEACEGLSEGYLENCIFLIAQEKKDVSVCAELGHSETSCIDAVLLARVADGEGIALCEGVSDVSKKNSCEAVVTANARASGECAKYGVPLEICDAQKIINDLLTAGNFAGCVELPAEERVQCEEIFSSRDSDVDGLSAREESILGTSDTNADTDGDGYLDRQEIEAGYNPLK